jgi:hypothetical protein
VASDRESGREKADRSSSSIHGFRSMREHRAVSNSQLMKRWEAGMASDTSESTEPEVGADASPTTGLVTGSNCTVVDAEAMSHCPAELNRAWLNHEGAT